MQATLRIPCLELAFNRSKGSLGPAERLTWEAGSYLPGTARLQGNCCKRGVPWRSVRILKSIGHAPPHRSRSERAGRQLLLGVEPAAA